MKLGDRIREKSIELGFDLVGIAPARRARHAEAFFAWLKNGYHAEMEWIARDPERRVDPRIVLDGAASVVVCGISYFTENPPADIWDDPARGRVARYAWGRDYHKVILPRLKKLATFIESESDNALCVRAYVDTGPVLERDFAAEAGLGFIGKNSLLISPEFGSFVFLGQLLVNLELEPDEPGFERAGTCGTCRRCLDVCPTLAFPAPYVVDSTRCLSYQTIEQRGNIPEALRPGFGSWIFGCDLCQSICPWVRQHARPPTDGWLKFDPDRAAPRLEELLRLDDRAFLNRFAGTPLMRPKRRGLLRNACIAAGNSGERELLPALKVAAQDSERLIRKHAAWAIERLG